MHGILVYIIKMLVSYGFLLGRLAGDQDMAKKNRETNHDFLYLCMTGACIEAYRHRHNFQDKYYPESNNDNHAYMYPFFHLLCLTVNF